MKVVLTGMLAILVCGCISRGRADLLQAKIRDQQTRISESERKISDVQSELKRTRREADGLRAELARTEKGAKVASDQEVLARATKLQIHSLLTGGINKDGVGGDDALVAHIAPTDDDGEVIKLPGNVELTLIDPALDDADRELGQWSFSADDCREKWTRGFTGTGYQFTVPLEKPAENESLVLHAKFTTIDGREFDSSQIIRIRPAGPSIVNAGHSIESEPKDDSDEEPLVLDDINDPPPDVVDSEDSDLPDWATEEVEEKQTSKSRRPVLRESTNWTDATIPVLR